jgi:signal transduction histidine kinase
VIVHQLLPLGAFFLNGCLALLALQRDARSLLNRVFAFFAAACSIWTFGVFMLRRSPDAATAMTWEVFIHAGVAFIPPLYYHFVTRFLTEPSDTRGMWRPIPLPMLYAIGGIVFLLVVTRSPLFLQGVQFLHWGWGPKPGPLYVVFIAWFNVVMVGGMWRLRKASLTFASSFRRNRARLVVLGTAVSLAGSMPDFATFLGQRLGTDQVFYPVGVVANMVFSLLVGTSIIRYRMFDVCAAVRNLAVYVSVGAAIASVAAVTIRAGAHVLDANGLDSSWLIVPGAVLVALALSPLGRRAGELVDHAMFRRRAGCYDTLLELSRAIGGMRTADEIGAALVSGVATRVPVTHCTLLTPEPGTEMLTCAREHVVVGMGSGEAALAIDGPVAGWLLRTGRVLVREGARTDAALVTRMQGGADELASLRATLVVPLRFGRHLTGVLAIGEKLSGEVFDAQEMDVLGVLAAQAALALDNARLLRESDERRHRAEQLNAELDGFVASTSHDLKAPLVTVEGLAELVLAAEGDRVSPTSRRYLERIQMNVRRMAQLVSDLLTISRVGRDTDMRERVNVDAILDEVLEALDDRVRARGVQIVRGPLGTVLARPSELTTVFTNLLTNAVGFLGERTDPRVDIGMREEPDELTFWVRDNGVGIDAAYHAKVFEMFQRLAEVPSEGTGLGLAMVKKIVDAAGGRVWLDSARGQGTTVWFTWPRTERVSGYRLAATTPVGHATPVPPSPQ